MFIVPDLKHNRVQQVEVPRPAELYKRLGFGSAAGKYSGDETLNPNESKIDQVKRVSEEAFEPEKSE